MEIGKVRLEELVADPANARRHSEKNISAIKGSLVRFGQQTPIVVDEKNVVIKGNGTVAAARELGWKEIDCVRTTLRSSTDKTAYALADNRTSELAEWDLEVLGKELQALREDGFDIEDIGFDIGDLGFDFDSDEDKDASPYTQKVESPIYEIRGERPELGEIYDLGKVEELKGEIARAKIDPEVKDFLLAAATRHAVFNYQKIAEYYAHADDDVKHLMERSALVIIDFDRAIEEGWVKLNQELKEAFGED